MGFRKEATKVNFDQQFNRRQTNSFKWAVGENKLPMSIADMDFQTAPAITNALAKKVKTGIYGYEMIPEAYYQAVGDWYATEHHARPKREWMLFVSGVVPALASVLRRLTNPGDQILIQAPVYNMFFTTIQNNGRQVLSSDLVYDPKQHTYHIDWEDLEAKFAQPLTTMMILCNPQNPGGMIWTKQELQHLAELGQKYGVTIFADEIHGDLTFNEGGYVPFFSLPEQFLQAVVVAVSPSKTFNIAATHAATLFVPNAYLREVVDQGLQNDGLTGVNLTAIPASIAAYTQSQEWYHELLDYLKGNLELVEQTIKEHLAGKVAVVPSAATYLVWLDISALSHDSVAFTDFLESTSGLILNPGTMYGEAGKHFVRMNVAYPRAVVADGLQRLIKGVKAWPK